MATTPARLPVYPTTPLEEIFDFRYADITDNASGTEEVVWTPQSGKRIRIASITVSVSSSGVVEIKDNTDDKIIMTLTFEERKAIPFSPPFLFSLPRDHKLSVKFTADSGTAHCYVTVFGSEL